MVVEKTVDCDGECVWLKAIAAIENVDSNDRVNEVERRLMRGEFEFDAYRRWLCRENELHRAIYGAIASSDDARLMRVWNDDNAPIDWLTNDVMLLDAAKKWRGPNPLGKDLRFGLIGGDDALLVGAYLALEVSRPIQADSANRYQRSFDRGPAPFTYLAGRAQRRSFHLGVFADRVRVEKWTHEDLRLIELGAKMVRQDDVDAYNSYLMLEESVA